MTRTKLPAKPGVRCASWISVKESMLAFAFRTEILDGVCASFRPIPLREQALGLVVTLVQPEVLYDRLDDEVNQAIDRI